MISSTESLIYISLYISLYSFAQSGSKAHNEMTAYIDAEENSNKAEKKLNLFTELCIIL